MGLSPKEGQCAGRRLPPLAELRREEWRRGGPGNQLAVPEGLGFAMDSGPLRKGTGPC